MIVTQNTKLNVVPGGIIPVVHVSQYDVDREISFTLYDGNGAAVLDNGTTVSIDGTKPDGHGFSYEGTLTGNVASFATTQQMTVLVGAIECKLTLRKDSQVIGTAMFILDVEKAGINEGTDISDTDIPMIISLATEQMERAEAAAVSANTSMIASGSSALIAGNAAAVCSSILPVVRGYAESAEDNAVLSGSYMRVAGESAEEAEYWAHYAEQHAGTGHVIVNENGESMPQRSKLKFINCDITDDSTNDTTIIEAEGGGGGTIVVVPTVTDTNPVYDGTQKSPTITRDTDHTSITGTYQATLPGSYTFTILLNGTNDVWSDNTTAPKVYNWSVAVPDGSTITPVNDIQLWLLCAGITDKSYTTLNEVLADQTTLAKLMSDNNAADYLVRSTSWVSGLTASQTGMNAIGASDYCSETLIGDSTWLTAILASAYKSVVINAEVPTMTSNTTPSGECFASSSYSASYSAYKAFDKVVSHDSTWYASESGTATNIYVGYKFLNPCKVCSFDVVFDVTDANPASVITSMTCAIQGSNDNQNWNTISSDFTKEDCTLSTTTQTYSYTGKITDVATYNYYRLLIKSQILNGACGRVSELKLYGRTPGGVQDWLKSASIDKNYITLSEVLADSTTLAALMLDSDAVDYLATATSWASTITANQTAMTDIGSDDYCADTLLDDATWRTAICNSTYFESVLNVKVPVMTSNTTPSGVASASTSYTPGGNLPYCAFDNNASTFWDSYGTLPDWIQYQFTAPICVRKLYFQNRGGTNKDIAVSFKLVASNSGNFTGEEDTLYQGTSTNQQNGGESSYVLNNDNSYSYYRLITNTTKNNEYVAFAKLQFYGR